MARRPFDPQGLGKVEYRQGDVLNWEDVDALAAEADVLVHLAFIIMGGREETRRINLDGSRQVFAAAVRHVKRLVYTSSVAAYGFHTDNPQPLTEDVHPRGSERFYYSAQKAELEQALADETAGTELETYVLRPSIVAGPDAPLLLRQLPPHPVPLPDPGTPLPARPPRRRRQRAGRRHPRRRPAGCLQPRGRGHGHDLRRGQGARPPRLPGAADPARPARRWAPISRSCPRSRSGSTPGGCRS